MDEEFLSAVRRYVKYITTAKVRSSRKEYALATEVFSQYNAICALMANKMCIVQPIRAVVMNRDNFDPVRIAEIYSRIGIDWGMYTDEADELVEDFDAYCRLTQTVGYVIGVRMESEEQYRIGYSLCMPQDYQNFNKEVGMALAFDDLNLNDSDHPYWVHSVKFTNVKKIMPPDCNKFYLFPLTVDMQVDRFETRCRKYFNVKEK